jgi:uncharacterized C2H2 Zn-finger protein
MQEYECCGMKFKTKEEYEKHMKEHHGHEHQHKHGSCH